MALPTAAPSTSSGYKLNLISVDETYVDTANAEQRYFPKTDALDYGSRPAVT